MAVVTDYKCSGCGLELTDDGRVFIWDDETNETKDFLILMSTHQLLWGAKISGKVSETFCKECDRYVKVYSINQVADGIDNPREVVIEGIKRHIERCARKLAELKDIRERSEYVVEEKENYFLVTVPEYEYFRYSNYLFADMSKDEVIRDAMNEFHEEIDSCIESKEKRYRRYLDSHYIILDEREECEFDISEKVQCPECGSEINKYVSGDLPCPRCGKAIFGFPTCYD